jgi:hypothetical protein
MAQSLDTLRSQILTSLFGRRLGLDQKEFLHGPKDLRLVVEEISTTAATSALPYGLTRVLTSGSSQTGSYTLQAPEPGVMKLLSLASTSTGGQQFTATNATIYSASAGTSSAVVNLFSPGAAVTLIGETTAVWRVMSVTGSSATSLVTFTTST